MYLSRRFIALAFAALCFALGSSSRAGDYAPTLAEISPPGGAKAVTVYNLIGMDWKTCPREQICEALDWLEEGDEVTVVGEEKEKGVSHYLVHGKDAKGMIYRGWVVASAVRFLDENKKEGPKEVRVSKTPKQEICDPKKRAQEKADPITKTAKEAKVIARAVEKKSRPPFYLLDPKNGIFNPDCSNFVDASGKVGPWGARLLHFMKTPSSDAHCFNGTIDVKPVCRNFNSFPKEKKEKFWLFVFAAMAQAESSCQPDARTKGVTKDDDGNIIEAVGLFQLEGSFQVRQDLNRDPVRCDAGKVERMSKTGIDFQAGCTTAILKQVHCRKTGPLRNVASKRGYWQELRGYSKISRAVGRFPGCF